MTEKVASAIEAYSMLECGERVLVALSGGADSTALLLVLAELGYDVRAAHINHNLRGPESLRDQRFCEELCKKFGIDLKVISVDVREYCIKKRISLETGARELRYKALYEAAEDDRIATAHTLSDCFETAVFNLTRGCGIRGICGIPPVRQSIIRPLIDCTRKDVEDYLKTRGQDYVTDSTNMTDDCSRNIIRLKVIPELMRINPGLMSSFAGTVKALREADAYVSEGSRSLFESRRCEYGCDFSQEKDSAALSGALAILLKEGGVEPSFERISAAKSLISEDGVINLKKDVYLRSQRGRLSIERRKALLESVTADLRSDIKAMGKIISVTKISHFDISRFNNNELRYFFDEAKMAEKFTIRPYCGNERIKLAGREHSSSVKKLLADVPAQQRKRRIVIDDGFGAVFVEEAGVSERVACSENTVSAIKIEITDI